MGTLYQLPPAPTKSHASKPINLGEYNPEYDGWFIIVDLGAPLRTNDVIALAADTDAHTRDRNRAVYDWLAAMLIEWNFVDDKGTPLPQPREGGAELCPQVLMTPISEAIGAVLNPKKA